MVTGLFFWPNTWISDYSVEDIASELFVTVPPSALGHRMVQDAIADNNLPFDTKKALTTSVFIQLLDFWEAIRRVTLPLMSLMFDFGHGSSQVFILQDPLTWPSSRPPSIFLVLIWRA